MEVKIKAGKPKKQKLPKEKTVAKLSDEVALILQRLVRARTAIEFNIGGGIACVSCGHIDHWLKMQGGHFISRDRKATKLMEENINPQCISCNKFHGNCGLVLSNYYEWLIAKHGKTFVERMKRAALQPKAYNREELSTLLSVYTKELNTLENILKGYK